MSKDKIISQALSKTVLTRRSFLKWSAVLGGTAALAGGANFGLKTIDAAAATESQQGKWIPADCWGDCGSKGFNKAYVVDGTVVRMGTDDTIPDSFDCPQLRSCARGRAQRLNLLGADRLKYPMKRKNWEPGGGKKELRGRDEWVRISWDEALDIVASELKRVKENYGNTAIFAPWIGVIPARALALYGGFTDQWAGHSGGTWSPAGVFTGTGGGWNDRYDLIKSKLIILWATNPVWSQAGLPAYTYLQAKKAGTRFIAVDPIYNPTYQMLADEWIPIRPATDHAMLLGMIHTLIVEDNPESNPLIDWDFLNRCTVGFDKDHMPEGADPQENLMDYVLGIHDGQPKDAVWASEICGAPADRIRSLAREYAQEQNASICASSAPARVDCADSMPQAFITLTAMTGHFGRSGSMLGITNHFGTNGGPQLVQGPNSRSYRISHTRAPTIPNPLAKNSKMAGEFVLVQTEGMINLCELWSAVVDGKYTIGPGKTKDIDIRMIYHAHGSRLNQIAGTMKAIEAHKKVEFVVTQNMFLNPDAQYSDIVLPITSRWEKWGNVCTGYREQLLWHSQVMEPYFESKDDLWIGVELGKRLGLDPKEIEPWSWKQEIFNEVADAKVVMEDGKTYESLVTITEQDLKVYGVEGVPQQGRIPIKEFQEKGIYHAPRSPDDNNGFIFLKAFRDDPVNNPVNSASGKLEIHCQALADYIKQCGWTEIRPIPTYNPPYEGYESTFKDWKNKVKGEYPLQLFNMHVPRRSHSWSDNALILREAFPHELVMNPIDAKERGIQNGDTALVTSRYGKILRPVWLTNIIIPGALALGQGAWVDLDEETGIDRAGCANVLKGATPSGGGQTGWNSSNVQVEKWTGDPLPPDYKVPQRIPLKEENA